MKENSEIKSTLIGKVRKDREKKKEIKREREKRYDRQREVEMRD